MCSATPAVKRKLRAGPALAGPALAAGPVIASRSAPIFPRYDARSW